MTTELNIHNDELDSDPLSTRVQAFRTLLRSRHDESEKFQACADMRDRLLEEQMELAVLVTDIEEVMVAECGLYKKSKGQWSNCSNADAKQWERFADMASTGKSLKKKCLAPLIKVGAFWNADKVQHYGWASMGWKFCKLLGTAASRNPVWGEATVKLNQLILRRISDGKPLRASVNPLEQIDLTNLAAWQGRDTFVKSGRNAHTLVYASILESDLPAGYTFDLHGLIVSKQVTMATQANKSRSLDHSTSLVVEAPMAASTMTASENTSIDLIAALVLPTPSDTLSRSESASSTPLTTPPQSPIGVSEMNPSLNTSPNSAPASPSFTALSEAGASQSCLRRSGRLRIQPDRVSVSSIGSSRQITQKECSRRQERRRTHNQASVCTCSDTISLKLLSAIERSQQTNVTEDVDIASIYRAHQNTLCPKHLKMYALWATRGILRSRHASDSELPSASKQQVPWANDLLSPYPASKRRRLSLPLQLSESSAFAGDIPLSENPGVFFVSVPENKNDARPFHAKATDARFRDQVLIQLRQKMTQSKFCTTWGELNTQGMFSLLSRAKQPLSTGAESEKEAYFSTGEEAERQLEAHTVLHGPLITENQQQFRWDPCKGRPIEQFFRRIGNLDRSISVQKASLRLHQPSFVLMRLGAVRDLFLKNERSEDPLNVLDLRNPLPRSILPRFLMGEDCQLLSRVRDTILEGATAERCSASIVEWNRWRDDEDWALLAQGGAQTLAHQDSCGKATWLTVQEGQVGFGWISRPSEEEVRSWSADPNAFEGGQIRYVVLQPGQTIYFEAGTIHFVFRLDQHQTLLLGGHVLRWSRIDSWIRIVLGQLLSPNCTNEDPLPSAPAYVEAVARLLAEQTHSGRTDLLASEEVVAKFTSAKKARSPNTRQHSTDTVEGVRPRDAEAERESVAFCLSCASFFI